MGYSSFSQNVIQSKDSVVVLSKSTAIKVAKDLIKGDSYKLIIIEQDKRIEDFKLQISQYKNIGEVNDSIVKYKTDLINVQNKIINQSNKLHIHGYVAIQTVRFTVLDPMIYAKVTLEYKKWNVGPIYYIQKTFAPDWGIILQYKVF